MVVRWACLLLPEVLVRIQLVTRPWKLLSFYSTWAFPKSYSLPGGAKKRRMQRDDSFHCPRPFQGRLKDRVLGNQPNKAVPRFTASSQSDRYIPNFRSSRMRAQLAKPVPEFIHESQSNQWLLMARSPIRRTRKKIGAANNQSYFSTG